METTNIIPFPSSFAYDVLNTCLHELAKFGDVEVDINQDRQRILISDPNCIVRQIDLQVLLFLKKGEMVEGQEEPIEDTTFMFWPKPTYAASVNHEAPEGFQDDLAAAVAWIPGDHYTSLQLFQQVYKIIQKGKDFGQSLKAEH